MLGLAKGAVKIQLRDSCRLAAPVLNATSPNNVSCKALEFLEFERLFNA